MIRSSEFELLSESVKQRQQQDGRQQILNRTDYERQRLREMAEKIARKDRNFKFETLQLTRRTGDIRIRLQMQEQYRFIRHLPMYSATAIMQQQDFGLADAGNIYGRLTNPTEDVFEQRMAALEGGVAALAVASGAAAITYTIENLAQAGDHIVAAKNIYGGTYNLLAHTLPQYGITDNICRSCLILTKLEAAIKDNTKALYIETLGNPNSDVVDIESTGKYRS